MLPSLESTASGSSPLVAGLVRSRLTTSPSERCAVHVLSRPRPHRSRAAGRSLVAAGALLALSGCSSDTVGRGFLPEGVTSESGRITSLWNGAWITALLVGVLVWGLIIWCMVAYRKRKDDTELPEQLRYNLPMEILYTVVPLMMVGVLFYFTARDETAILDVKTNPDNVVNVVGKRWAWDFNYITDNAYESTIQVDPAEVKVGQLPTMYLPVNKRTKFLLTARDVNHSFWVVQFLVKQDMIAGKVNEIEVTPTQTGTFTGKCAELCGPYHSEMLFQVKVVEEGEYKQHIADLKARGQEGALPNTLNPSDLEPGQRAQDPTQAEGGAS